jgi:hypothetical protein
MVQHIKEKHMTRLWGWRVPKRGLGLLMTDNGVAMAQSPSSDGESGQHCAWHWQGCSLKPPGPEAAWPPAGLVRQALAKSGFQAQATALAVPETELQRFSLTLDAGLNARQMHQAIAAQLNSLLTLPLIDAVWDFEISVHNATASPLPGNQPAWLQAAMQTQSTLSADVLVITRAWVNTCEQWCRAAGLQLVRLEPPWQASSRWQLFSQQHNNPAAETLADVLSIQQQAVLGGLALGAVTP